MSAEGPAPSFRAAASRALGDPQLRSNFRRAMDGLMAKRAAAFADPAEWRDLRALGAAIRARSLAQLPELLERLEERCRENGIDVHWAETADEANAIVLGILEQHGATRVVKGKSMVSEEMHLNDYPRARTASSRSSRTSANTSSSSTARRRRTSSCPRSTRTASRSRGSSARRSASAEYTEDVDALTAIARRVLRRKFFEAEAGISGVNFAVAETGTLCLVENEGNGRMSTHVPPVHIALMGIEKVVERLEDVPPLYVLLTRSATGQPITTYFNMITGPRAPGEKDGPREVHLVILDNGRSRIVRRPRAARDAALHPLRRLHEPLPGLHARRRPCLRGRLSRARSASS